jgi:very-short-patch-repair endonuclease
LAVCWPLSFLPFPLKGEGVAKRRKGAPLVNLRARYLRRNMTEAERLLWKMLRRKQFDGFRFRRQHPIGPYIADFFCPAAKLIVELDGGQHAEEEHVLRDRVRTSWLRSRGCRVLRIWNNELTQNPEDVREAIYAALASPLPVLRTTFPQKGKAGRSLMSNTKLNSHGV